MASVTPAQMRWHMKRALRHPEADIRPADPSDGRLWKPVYGAWLAEVAQRTGSRRTPEEYGRYMARFIDGRASPGHMNPAHVHAFAYETGPSGREPSPSTVIVRLAAISSFYNFARRMGLVKSNPADDVKRPKARQPAPRGLELEELRRLLDGIPDTPGGKRDRAIILTAVLAGLRRREILSLRAEDLTRNGAVYYTVRVKGGQERRRELPAPAFNAIVDALEAQGRPLEGLDPQDRIFDIAHQTYYAYLRKHARRAGLAGLKPHDLRNTAAKLRRNNGASIEDISAFLGHRNIATTATYLARMEGEDDNGWQQVADALGVA